MAEKELNEMTLRGIRALYYTRCSDIAREALEIEDEDERETFLNESVDGSEWVIYTYRARLVAVLTDNVDAISDAIGGDVSPTPVAIAYFAMLADVRQQMASLEALADA
jgi:hypothetical protein